MKFSKYLIGFVFFVMFTISLQAQVKHIFHNTYELDEVKVIELDVVGKVKFVKWQGTNLMTETVVELGNATKGILRHLINKQRYDLVEVSEEDVLKIESVTKERKAVITRSGTCDERVAVLIYVPKNFQVKSDHLLVKVDNDDALAETVTGDE